MNEMNRTACFIRFIMRHLLSQQCHFCEGAASFFLSHFWQKNLLFLSYYFTKKRPSKIFKIEKINRQTTCKNVLI